MRRTLKYGLVAIGVPFLVIQLVRPERANPPSDPSSSIEARMKVPSDVATILDRSCRDCHSNETRWPWYSNIAPVSWLVADDVADGRKQVNFSEWGRYTPDEAKARLLYIAFAAQSGAMPKANYVRLHPSARLSSEDVEALSRWAETESR
jgi:hypothetical protein